MKRLGLYSFSPLRDNLVNVCCCLLVEDNLFAPSSLVYAFRFLSTYLPYTLAPTFLLLQRYSLRGGRRRRTIWSRGRRRREGEGELAPLRRMARASFPSPPSSFLSVLWHCTFVQVDITWSPGPKGAMNHGRDPGIPAARPHIRRCPQDT